jgi:hypothetical protein
MSSACRVTAYRQMAKASTLLRRGLLFYDDSEDLPVVWNQRRHGSALLACTANMPLQRIHHVLQPVADVVDLKCLSAYVDSDIQLENVPGTVLDANVAHGSLGCLMNLPSPHGAGCHIRRNAESDAQLRPCHFSPVRPSALLVEAESPAHKGHALVAKKRRIIWA